MMPALLEPVGGAFADEVAIKTVVVSVFDKTGLHDLISQLDHHQASFVSTGGTSKFLREASFSVKEVSDLTKCNEILDGRVKTLHPKLYGGILAARGNSDHEASLKAEGIPFIDMVVVNLYPFDRAAETGSWDSCIENIDIGGVSLIRAAAKNCSAVAVVSSPAQYGEIVKELKQRNGSLCMETRKRLAAEAFGRTASYDSGIAEFFRSHKAVNSSTLHLTYAKEFDLKYGLNSHQQAMVFRSDNQRSLPFCTVNGAPGYINLLDAINAWQLVVELEQATGLPAAASFKHVSPAGAAVGLPLNEVEKAVYFIDSSLIVSPIAAAYIRARNSDPVCSFGDFAAVSGVVDASLANVLKMEVSDGIIAAGFSDEALAILKTKKAGAFIMLKGDKDFKPPAFENREIFGVVLRQQRNAKLMDLSALNDIRTQRKILPEEAKLDLTIATIAAKYTQSNSVVYARGGMTIGVGAGQQSRVDCVKLAGKKAGNWWLRFHPDVLDIKYADGLKRHEKNNLRLQFVEDSLNPNAIEAYKEQFSPEQKKFCLSDSEKDQFLAKLKGVSLSSDAFFPFTDCFCCKHYGVEYIAQPGGSVADEEVIKASDNNNITMVFTGVRLFHH